MPNEQGDEAETREQGEAKLHIRFLKPTVEWEEPFSKLSCLCYILWPFSMAAHAAVFVILWNWFVAPLGLPHLGFWHGSGLLLLIGFLRSKPLRYDEFRRQRRRRDPAMNYAFTLTNLVGGYIYLLFVLLAGWFLHLLLQEGSR